jgi:glycosyltransferase involved in cell wall biosynthesis
VIELSIVMPVFNEAATVANAVERVLAVEYPCPVELIVVDDGSTDLTARLLRSYVKRGVTVLCHPVNRGKGAAVLTGVRRATGTHVLILDADLEYTPADIPALLEPVIAGISDHVFGTRVFGLNTRFPSYRFAMGGRITTAVANMLFDSCLTDMHTCLKLVPLEHFRCLALAQQGFGLDTELTAMMLHAGVRPYEVPITYNGRTLEQGKKIGWLDGLSCMRILMWTRMKRSPALPPGPFGQARIGLVPASPGSRANRSLHLDDEPDWEMLDAAT